MKAQPKLEGIAFTCDAQGKIFEILRDDLGMGRIISSGMRFPFVVDRQSLGDSLDFLIEVRTRGAALSRPVKIKDTPQISPLLWGGVAAEDKLLVLGARTVGDVLGLAEMLQEIREEQFRKLQDASRIELKKGRSGITGDEDILDEFTRLNNELLNVQRELAKKNVELENLDKQKNRFLGMAAHDLRHPLGIIRMYSAFLLDETTHTLSQEQIEYLMIIRSASESMSRIIDEFLDVAMIASGRLNVERSPCDLIDLIDKNVRMNRILSEKKNIVLEFHHEEDIPQVLVDRERIEQVLNNLIQNAVKFSRPKKRIDVYLSRSEQEAIIKIRDEGMGISEEQKGYIFELFKHARIQDAEGERGLGLGLAITRKIVEAHGGRIWFKSEFGKGSTFYVALPLESRP